MQNRLRILVACGLLAAVGMPDILMAQNAAPKDPTGKMAPSGAAVAPSQSTAEGGKRPPTDTTGQTAPAGTPLAPSRLAEPSATPAPSSPPRQ